MDKTVVERYSERYGEKYGEHTVLSMNTNFP